MAKRLHVINSKGEEERFSSKKVYQSAREVGASKDLAIEISEAVKAEAYPGIKTSEIAKIVRKLLAREKPEAALKFNLKEAMRRLGPTGFIFEKYVGEIFVKNGFKVNLNEEIAGACCCYEIDFIATKGRLVIIGECKYRNLAGGRVDLKEALENYARFLDIQKGPFCKKGIFEKKEFKSLIVTNTKFTEEAIKYAQCVGFDLLGWEYPKGKGLEDTIDKESLYPVTILPSFKKYMEKVFAGKRMMLVEDVLKLKRRDFCEKNNIPEKHFKKLVSEAEILLGDKKGLDK